MRRLLAVICCGLLALSLACFVMAEETAPLTDPTGTEPTGTEPGEQPDPSEAFIVAMREEGFPEDYIPGLAALHERFPNWVFRAQKMPYGWQDLVAAESVVGINMIMRTAIDSWKSCDKGAFDPATGRWYGTDGESWVTPSYGLLTYTLDPRNALNETDIFQFENLAWSEVCTPEGVRAILAGSFMDSDEFVEAFMKAGKESGVSPYHLASRARQEQGRNGNALGKGTASGYMGYYNIFNIRAYTTSTLSAIQNGARYAATTDPRYFLPWTSAELSIRGGAVLLGENYIKRGQNTLYLQKYNLAKGSSGYFASHQYMGNVIAPASEAAKLAAAYTDEMKQGSMEFCIPVYEGMPETPCVKPTAAGNNNNWLKALAVEGQSLTPTFDLYTQEYELVVPTETRFVTLAAVPYEAGAAVTGTGQQPLAEGTNLLTVSVTAPSGEVREYRLSVYRTPSGGEQPEDPPTLTSETYRITDGVGGISPETPAEELIAGVKTQEGLTLWVADAAGHPVTGSVGTGMLLQVSRGEELLASYPLTVRGDVSGDGRINALDLLKIQKHILVVAPLTGAALEAADANADGAVNALDLLRTQRHILNLATIEP